MPYIIINDSDGVDTPHYYCGQGFRIGVDTTVEEQAAERFATLPEATAPMQQGKSILYRAGWRVVPVN